MKEDMSLSNLGTVAFHAAKVPTNVFSSTLICLLTLDYHTYYVIFVTSQTRHVFGVLTLFSGPLKLCIFAIILEGMDRFLKCLHQNVDIYKCQPYLQSF